MIGETYYDENGQPLGEIHQADDGNFVIVGYEGEIVAAATPDGQALAPDAYETVAPEPDYVTHDEFAAYEQQQLEQRLAQLEAVAQQPPPMQGQPPMTDERSVAMMESNFELLARQYGRQLTTKEVEGVLGELQTQINAGREPNFETAASQVGLKPHLEMNHEDRVAHMTQRLHEDQNDGLAGHQPQRESYDLEDRQQRQQWGADRLNGALSDEEAHARVAQPSEPEAA